MFKKNKKINNDKIQVEVDNQDSSKKPLYDKPKILLIDVEKSVVSTLAVAGYNISVGSFGKLYRVEKKDGYVPIIPQGSLPLNYQENEIVVVDLQVTDILDNPEGEKTTSLGDLDWWVSSSMGIVDPRPRLTDLVRNNFDRILESRGVFMIFAAPCFPQEINLAHVQHTFGLRNNKRINRNNWSFLSVLDRLTVSEDNGEEIITESSEFCQFLEAHLGRMHYQCTLSSSWVDIKKRWFPIAKNKYGNIVSVLIALGDLEKGDSQFIFIFPQVEDKAGFLKIFLEEELPNLAPHLFPHFEGAKWVHRPEYELPKVRELQHQIQEVRETADREIEILTNAITEEQTAYDYLYKLLTASGDELVKAVEVAVQTLGFTSIINVDEQAKAAGDTSPKREDLQIHDNSPIILVEIKGISHLPRDADALQVWKYFAPRMKEWNRQDIGGLAIVNHQKNLPPLQRENDNVFREDVITNAEDNDFGLMTTWSLFRLVRSFLSNDWSHDQIKSIFYQNGQIDPIPDHYEEIGIVEHVWPKAQAFGVIVQNQAINLGDKIAFEFPVEFKEQIIESLQQEKQTVETVNPGDLAGIQTSLIDQGLRKGIKVYKVNEVP
jgi:hypothetical protein